MKRVLLLNSTEEVLAFISERKAIRLLYKQKVDVVSSWMDDMFVWFGQLMHFPAIIKMRYYVGRRVTKLLFSRKAVLKRDKYTCQYCSKPFKIGTIDHIVPRSLGGQSTFTNCVAACFLCNKKKADKPLETTNLKLISMPIQPSAHTFFIQDGEMHNDWEQFLHQNRNVLV
jgi:hypothetical protein